MRTATLVQTAVGLSLTSSTTTTTTSPITINGHVTVGTGPVGGIPVALMVTCRGAFVDAINATPTTNGNGDVSVTLRQTLPECTYRWQISGQPNFMGSASDTVTVNATLPVPITPPRNR
jgi:hypothetical protein